MAKKIDSFMYPDQLFLVQENGGYQFYKEDPMSCVDREAAKINLGETIVGWVGGCDIGNPVVLKIRVGRLDRCRPFTASVPEKIRRGLMAVHLEDFDANYVEMLPSGSGNSAFPFLGAVVRKDGEPVGFRQYSVRGECSDGEASHRVVVIDGLRRIDVVEDDPDGKKEKAPARAAAKAAVPVAEPEGGNGEEPVKKPASKKPARKAPKKKPVETASLFDDRGIREESPAVESPAEVADDVPAEALADVPADLDEE
jgi:hypothetical protein